MSYKIHVTLGEFASAFKAKKNSGIRELLIRSRQIKEFHDIKLTGERKFNITETDTVYEIKEFNELVNCPKIIVENPANVETKFPQRKEYFQTLKIKIISY